MVYPYPLQRPEQGLATDSLIPHINLSDSLCFWLFIGIFDHASDLNKNYYHLQQLFMDRHFLPLNTEIEDNSIRRLQSGYRTYI